MHYFKRLADEPFYNGVNRRGPKVNGQRTTEWDCYPRKYWLGHRIESITFHAPQAVIIRKRRDP